MKKFRYEKKYLLNRDTAYFLNQRISYVLSHDNSSPDGSYKVSSMYFDDQYNSAFHEKQLGSLRRDKYRARYYNGNTDKIRFERKHKHDYMIYKESSFITPENYLSMLNGDYRFMTHEHDSVFRKFYTEHSIKRMRPVILVEYNRQAYMHTIGNVRITFDTDLSASKPDQMVSFSILGNENVIMEIKYNHFIPSFINDLITGANFTQQLAISKFIMAKLALHRIK